MREPTRDPRWDEAPALTGDEADDLKQLLTPEAYAQWVKGTGLDKSAPTSQAPAERPLTREEIIAQAEEGWQAGRSTS